MNDGLLNNDINHEWKNYCERLSKSLIENKNILPNNKIISRILTQVQIIFKNEKMLIQTITPITIVGDIHGQYEDLLTIFKKKVFQIKLIDIYFSVIIVIEVINH